MNAIKGLVSETKCAPREMSALTAEEGARKVLALVPHWPELMPLLAMKTSWLPVL